MKRYKKYVYYLTLDHYHIRLNLNILNLETNEITLFPLRFRYAKLRKRLGINFLRDIETHIPEIRTTRIFKDKSREIKYRKLATRLFNEKSSNIKYRKLVKKIKNYKRDWWKGDMERTIRKLETGVIFIGGA